MEFSVYIYKAIRQRGPFSSFPSSRPGLGDCDVTGGMFKSKMNNKSMLHSILKYKHAAEMHKTKNKSNMASTSRFQNRYP